MAHWYQDGPSMITSSITRLPGWAIIGYAVSGIGPFIRPENYPREVRKRAI